MNANRNREWTRIDAKTGEPQINQPSFGSRRTMAGKLQIYADNGGGNLIAATDVVRQPPDYVGQERAQRAQKITANGRE
jgi:hypothetical protein